MYWSSQGGQLSWHPTSHLSQAPMSGVGSMSFVPHSLTLDYFKCFMLCVCIPSYCPPIFNVRKGTRF